MSEQDELQKRLASRFCELRSIYVNNLLWIIGREGDTIFVSYPDLSKCWWTYIGTIDWFLSLPVGEIAAYLTMLERTRPQVWFPPSQWKNGIHFTGDCVADYPLRAMKG